MALTELTLFPSLSPSLTPGLKAVAERASATQEAWLAKHYYKDPDVPAPSRAARGVALFRQIEDPKMYLHTAVWDSAEQVAAWQGSEEGSGVVGFLMDEFDLKGTSRWDVQGDLFREGAAAAGGNEAAAVGLLEAPIVSLNTARVRTSDKEEFTRRWGEFESSLVEYARPYAVSHGWSDGEGEDGELLFFLFCAWPTVEKHLGFRDSEGFKKAGPALKEVGTFMGAKHYQRVL